MPAAALANHGKSKLCSNYRRSNRGKTREGIPAATGGGKDSGEKDRERITEESYRTIRAERGLQLRAHDFLVGVGEL